MKSRIPSCRSLLMAFLVVLLLGSLTPTASACDWECYMSYDIVFCQGVQTGNGTMWECWDRCVWVWCGEPPYSPCCFWVCEGYYCW